MSKELLVVWRLPGCYDDLDLWAIKCDDGVVTMSRESLQKLRCLIDDALINWTNQASAKGKEDE